MTLIEFLLERIAEDEAVADACVYPQHGGCWSHDDDGEVSVGDLLVSHPTMVCHAVHIARHDPARVLAECEAKRRIVEELATQERRAAVNSTDHADATRVLDQTRITQTRTFGWQVKGCVDTLRFAVATLALPYADHPDYDEEWRV